MDYKRIGEKIRKHRIGKMTQAELAEKIGRSESSVRKYEKGLTEIPHSVIEKIASVLGVDAFELYAYDFKDLKPPIDLQLFAEPADSTATHRTLSFTSEEYNEHELEQIQTFAEFLKYQRH